MEQHFVLGGVAQDVNEWRICCVMTFPSLRKNRFQFCEHEHLNLTFPLPFSCLQLSTPSGERDGSLWQLFAKDRG